MTFQVGIDVGGTFTDLVAVDDNGKAVTAKSPTTPANHTDGIVNGLEQLAEKYGIDLRAFLSQTAVIVQGTTVVTNTMLEYNGALTGLVCTKGFRDIIELRRSFRENLFDIRYPPPVPIVRRQRRLGVTERIDYSGKVVIPLDEDEVQAAVQRFREWGVQSVAVCLLFAHVNPVHERRIREIILKELPDVYVTLSSEVLPQVREFERLSTTLVNAYTTPRLKYYLSQLSGRLAEYDFKGDLLVMQSNGGILDTVHASELGVGAVMSGPAGGVVAAAYIGQLCGSSNVIGVDMGGTSYDVSLIRDAIPQVRTDAWISRYRVAYPILDIHTIGAGGGSIGWIDPFGALHVGPQSAGAQPGPACYDRGGELPTVTDADLILGYINPDFFLGGKIRLREDLACRAMEEHLARPMKVDIVEAAVGMFRIVNNNMTNGVRYVSVSRGHDPRDFALIAFGGAGALHAGLQAEDLGIDRVLVPKDASVFCALGELISDLKVNLMRPFFSRGKNLQVKTLNELFAEMNAEAQTRFTRSKNVILDIQRRRFMDVRYAGQTHEVTVPIEVEGDKITDADLEAAIARFHELHEAIYAFKNPDQVIEVLTLRYDMYGLRSKPDFPEFPLEPVVNPEAALKGYRTAYFPIKGVFQAVEAPYFDGAALKPGSVIAGPAIIEEVFTTIVVYDGHRAELNKHMVYIMTTGKERRSDEQS